jgi:hypothetical protein
MAEATVAAIVISGMTTAATAYASYSAAQSQNRALRRAQKSAKDIYELRSDALKQRRVAALKGVLEQRDIAVLQQTAGLNKAKGEIKVAMAGAGLSTGSGTGLSLIQDLYAQQELNNYVLRESTRNAIEGIQSGFKADSINAIASYEQQFNAAQAQMQNAALSGFASGVAGIGTGLSITGGLQDAGFFQGGGASGNSWQGVPYS